MKTGDVLFTPSSSLVIEKSIGVSSIGVRSTCTVYNSHSVKALAKLSELLPTQLGIKLS